MRIFKNYEQRCDNKVSVDLYVIDTKPDDEVERLIELLNAASLHDLANLSEYKLKTFIEKLKEVPFKKKILCEDNLEEWVEIELLDGGFSLEQYHLI